MAAGGEGMRVLVVEDDFLNAMAMKQALETCGVLVVGPVGVEREALAMVEREPPDGAFLDINLGSTTSFGIATALGERGVPFAFVTGYADKPVPAHLQHAPRLIKPVKHHELKAVIESFAAGINGA